MMPDRYNDGINPIEDGFYLSTFFAPLRTPSGGRGDAIGSVFLDPEDGKYHVIYRFRWYVDEKIYDSEDKKSWFHGVLNTKDQAVAEKAFRDVTVPMQRLGMIDDSSSIPLTFVIINGDGNKFIEIVAKQPWAHVRPSSWDGKQELEG